MSFQVSLRSINQSILCIAPGNREITAEPRGRMVFKVEIRRRRPLQPHNQSHFGRR